MKNIIFTCLLFSAAVIANDTAHHFANNKECQACHSKIYEEFAGSMHANALPQKDPIHKAVWDKHPQNKKQERYGCGKCHTPAADNLDNMLKKGQKALPQSSNETHSDGISCAYCHRIKNIEKDAKSNTNIISKKEKKYFGTLKDHIASPFQT